MKHEKTKHIMKRLLALDIFRGMTIALMILVNTPGSWSYVYPPFMHADWNGCTPTDLVFPFFLFIVGVSMYFSFSKFQYRLSNIAVKTILKRGFLIFLVGFFLNAYPIYNLVWETERILGVLQRIGICFGVGGVLCLALSDKQLWVAVVVILLSYWGILNLVQPDPLSLEDNLVRKLDILILGSGHLWGGKGIPFDPEGLLSTLPALANVIFGYKTGQLIKTTENKILLFQKMVLFGAIGTVAAIAWSFVFPFNKSLWTSSYALYTSSLGCIVLAIQIWVIDVRGVKAWAKPFHVFGVNPLFAYVLSSLWVQTYFIFKWVSSVGEKNNLYGYIWKEGFASWAGNMNGSLLFALFHVFIFWLICYPLYKNKIYIKI